MVKNLPTMQETWVQSLVWENPLEKGMATHSSIPAWRIPWTVEFMSDTTERLTLSHFLCPQALPNQSDKDIFPKPAGLSVLVRKSSSTH